MRDFALGGVISERGKIQEMTERQQRMKQEVRKRVIIKKVISILAVLAVIAAVYFLLEWATALVERAMIRITTVQFGRVEDVIRCRAVVIRSEKVVTAPAAGRFENLILEGERVRRGTLIGYLYREGDYESIPLYAPRSGKVCYHPDNIEQMTQNFELNSSVEKLFSKEVSPVSDGSFSYDKGDAVFKIIDNCVPAKLIVELPANLNPAQGLKLQSNYSIRCHGKDLGEAEYTEEINLHGKKYGCLTLESFADSLMEVRHTYVDIIRTAHEGIIVPTKAIIKGQGGQYKLYCIDKGIVRLQPVKIVYRSNNGKTVVDGLTPGDRIVTTPGLVKEGMMLE